MKKRDGRKSRPSLYVNVRHGGLALLLKHPLYGLEDAA
jgi:hypothetical protein